jgi:glycosyltransferase involved in cell wall biosynthesis
MGLRSPLIFIPNGVDTARFEGNPEMRTSWRALLAIPDDAPTALFVGYLTQRKGVAALLDSWHRVHDLSGDQRSPYLILAGPSQGDYRALDPELRLRAVSRDSYNAGIRVLDEVPGDQMPALYAAADAFVFPTLGEGMPNSLLEALAAGLPAIASDVPGVSDVLTASAGNVLVDLDEPEQLDAALATFLSQHHAMALPRKSRLPASMELSHIAAMYADVYRLLARAKRREVSEALGSIAATTGSSW